jgi:hypothetical protein
LALIALAIIGVGAGAITVTLLRHSGGGKSPDASSTTQGPTGGSSTSTGTATGTGALDIIQAINSPSSGPFPSGFTGYTLQASAVGTTAGFSLSYPGSWSVQRSSYQTYFRDPDLNAWVLIDLTPHTYPGDMLREARYIKFNSASIHPGYVQLTLARLTIRGAPGSYWKFTYTDNGVPQEVLDLLWVQNTSAGNQSYAMYFTAPAASWGALRPTFTAIAQSFEPVTS